MKNEDAPFTNIVRNDEASDPLASGDLDATERGIFMTPDEQYAFWTALGACVELSPAQQRLAKIVRGE
jgi:hypothetical protein